MIKQFWQSLTIIAGLVRNNFINTVLSRFSKSSVLVILCKPKYSLSQFQAAGPEKRKNCQYHIWLTINMQQYVSAHHPVLCSVWCQVTNTGFMIAPQKRRQTVRRQNMTIAERCIAPMIAVKNWPSKKSNVLR